MVAERKNMRIDHEIFGQGICQEDNIDYGKDIELLSDPETITLYRVKEGLVAVTQQQKPTDIPQYEDEQWVVKTVKPRMIFGFENIDGKTKDQELYRATACTDKVVLQTVTFRRDQLTVDQMFALYQLIAMVDLEASNKQRFIRNGQAPQRVARAFIDASLPTGNRDEHEVHLSQEMIGGLACVSREFVSKQAGRLQALGIIRKEEVSPGRDRFFIADMGRLQERASREYPRRR